MIHAEGRGRRKGVHAETAEEAEGRGGVALAAKPHLSPDVPVDCTAAGMQEPAAQSSISAPLLLLRGFCVTLSGSRA